MEAHMSVQTPLDTGTGYILWLACVIGFCGIHRFYAGKWVTGLLWICTGGICGVGQLIDLFLMDGMIAEGNRSRSR
jgi:TM2 domain-containing membrane protein YozV